MPKVARRLILGCEPSDRGYRNRTEGPRMPLQSATYVQHNVSDVLPVHWATVSLAERLEGV